MSPRVTSTDPMVRGECPGGLPVRLVDAYSTMNYSLYGILVSRPRGCLHRDSLWLTGPVRRLRSFASRVTSETNPIFHNMHNS